MKTLTRDQVEGRKERAVTFVRNVLGDDDRADEIEDESLEDYAERRKIEIINPRRSNTMPSNKELQERIQELEDENEELRDQVDAVADIVAPEEDDDEEDEGENGDDYPED